MCYDNCPLCSCLHTLGHYILRIPVALFGHQPQPKLDQYVLKIVFVDVFPGRACDPVLNLNRSIKYKY